MHQKPLDIRFFTGTQVMYPKIRFCELTTDEIQEIMDKAVPETTKKAVKFGMRLFYGTYLLCFPYNLQNFKCDRRDFTHF